MAGQRNAMDLKTNTIAGWVLGAAGAALGLSIVGGMIYHGGRPEKMGYPIEGVEAEGSGGGAAEVPIASLLPTADAAKGAEVFKKCAACHTINQGGANGRSVRARVSAIIVAAWAPSLAPSAMPPSPPASLTAAAMAGVETPAIGACNRGCVIPKTERHASMTKLRP